ncbi:MAG TPA: amino acid--tRNA ligase-related protein, partial [Amnibacterium sp.]|nr:amino acid--tRNA ligase-related protein [Amnibacterium sp.]
MTDDNAESDRIEQREVRLAKRKRLLEQGGEAYPVAVPVTTTIATLRGRFAGLESDTATGERAGVAGRVVHLRNTGKLCFAALQAGDGSRIQAMVSLDGVGEESLAEFKALVDLGDQLFVAGEVITSRRGELSVRADEWRIASKALLPLPNLHSELSEETRVRSRYLDLIARPEARRMVHARAAAVSSLRSTFTKRGYIELETPMLQTQQGGASARPFRTVSHAYDTDLYLRIAPELFLKRAAVGGLERIYEINRNFRDENPDATHSPEFAMLEAYEAFSDYRGMADLTQELVQQAAIAAGGTAEVTWFDGTRFDVGGTWDRISMYPSLSAAAGIEITPETPLAELVALTDRLEIEVPHPIRGKYVEE